VRSPRARAWVSASVAMCRRGVGRVELDARVERTKSRRRRRRSRRRRRGSRFRQRESGRPRRTPRRRTRESGGRGVNHGGRGLNQDHFRVNHAEGGVNVGDIDVLHRARFLRRAARPPTQRSRGLGYENQIAVPTVNPAPPRTKPIRRRKGLPSGAHAYGRGTRERSTAPSPGGTGERPAEPSVG
jgi:hypothetical protein